MRRPTLEPPASSVYEKQEEGPYWPEVDSINTGDITEHTNECK